VKAALDALRFSDARPEKLRELSNAEWNDLLSRWDFDRFTFPLRQVCGNFLPEWVQKKLDIDMVRCGNRFELFKREYSVLSSAITAAGAEHLVLKGFAQWPGYVEHPGLRRQSDIDIYCPPDSIERARNAILNLGYEPLDWVERGPSDHLPTLMRKTGWKWRGDPFDPEMPIPVEVHFQLWDRQNSQIGPKNLDEFWFRRISRTLEDIAFPGFNPVDGLGYFSLHILRDLLRGTLRTYNLYELGRFLHNSTNDLAFWESWLDLHDESLRSLQVIPFRLAAHLFGCRVPAEAARDIERLPSGVKAWFELFADSALVAEYHPNKDLVWLRVALLETSRQKRKTLMARLFPPRVTPLEAPYAQDQTVAGQLNPPSAFRRRVRHLSYVASRVGYHLGILPPTLGRGVRWWLAAKSVKKDFWKFFTASFFFVFGMFIFFLLYNLFLLDRGFKEHFLGMVTSAASIGSIVGTVPAGILAQRFGLKKALLLCVTLAPGIFALRSVLGGEVALLALSFLGGATFTIWAVCISPAVAQLTSPQSRPFGFSLMFSSGVAIGILGGQAGGLLPGWLAHIGSSITPLRAKQCALLIACGIMALAVWPISRLHFEVAPSREKRLYPKNPFLLRYLPAIALWSLAVGAFSPFFNVYLSQHLRLPVKQIGSIFSGSQLVQVGAMLLAPLVLKKFGLVTGIMYTQIAAALALACLAVVPGASTAAVIFMTYTAFQWMSEPGMYSLLMNQVAPSEQTGASALNFLVVNISQAIAAIAAGAAFERLGYPTVLGVIAAVGLFAAGAFRLLLGRKAEAASQAVPVRAS
jgi:predicted MFS family arabinose efflux permease